MTTEGFRKLVPWCRMGYVMGKNDYDRREPRDGRVLDRDAKPVAPTKTPRKLSPGGEARVREALRRGTALVYWLSSALIPFGRGPSAGGGFSDPSTPLPKRRP